jgi:hypothetical protein
MWVIIYILIGYIIYMVVGVVCMCMVDDGELVTWLDDCPDPYLRLAMLHIWPYLCWRMLCL